MKISKPGKDFLARVSVDDEPEPAVNELAYSERLMISVDLQVLQEILVAEVRDILDMQLTGNKMPAKGVC